MRRQSVAHPVNQFGMVGMGGIIAHGPDICPDRHAAAMNPDLVGTALNDRAERTLRLIADKQHRGIVADEVVAQMMLDAPASHMPEAAMMMAPPVTLLMSLALLNAFDDAEARIGEELIGGQLDVLEHLGVVLVDGRHLAGEGLSRNTRLGLISPLAISAPMSCRSSCCAPRRRPGSRGCRHAPSPG